MGARSGRAAGGTERSDLPAGLPYGCKEDSRQLIYAQPAGGITDSQHFVFRADGATRIGEPTERNESDRVEWIPLADIPGMISRQEIVSGATLVGVMALLLDLGAWAALPEA
jgi:hypothetical protein